MSKVTINESKSQLINPCSTISPVVVYEQSYNKRKQITTMTQATDISVTLLSMSKVTINESKSQRSGANNSSMSVVVYEQSYNKRKQITTHKNQYLA